MGKGKTMTKEEAISEWTFRSNHIKKWLDEYGEEPSIRHYVELIDMAIEALQSTMSQERVNHESTNDLISRADTLAKIKEYCIDGDSVVQNWFDTMGIEEIINTMPSVSAKPTGDLISRADAIEAVRIVWMRGNQGSEVLREVTAHIKALPSVSAESAIRCKDCIHYEFADNRAFGMPVKYCDWFGFEGVDDNDFCSRGERREE